MAKNLIPVQRPDKNGVMVTRWVTPEDAAQQKASRIPSPEVEARRAKVRAIRDQIFQYDSGGDSLAEEVKTIAILEKAVPDVLDRVVAAAQSDSDMRENVITVLNFQPFKDMPKELIRGFFNNMLLIQPFTKKVMVEVLKESDGDYMRDEMFRMEKTVADMKRASGYVKPATTKAMVLVSMMTGLHERFDTDPAKMYPMVKDNIDFIAEHIDEVEDILPMLRERRTFDRKVIQELISTPSKSFTSGVL